MLYLIITLCFSLSKFNNVDNVVSTKTKVFSLRLTTYIVR